MGDEQARGREGAERAAPAAQARDDLVADLDAALGRVRRLHSLQQVFMAAVAHDLKGPVSGMRVLLEHLRERETRRVPAEWRRARAVLEENLDAVRRILDDLGYLGTVTAGSFEPAPEPTDLAAIVRDVMQSVDFDRRHVEIRLDAAPVVTDPGLAARIAANVLQNAARHTPGRAHVWVTTGSTAAGARLAVADDGPGLPPWDLETLEGDDSVASRRLGGLFVVARFVEALGGRLAAGDRAGGGLEIEVTLPGEGPDPGGSPPPP
ncbi:MAG TPA: HAMP domain-containing sensor histidine kinase [Acidimicrobiia bacterium]|nr:HAMP domain-containing sensor histidine kinase [Acidimicrobiia bacterium]